jgi:hypothetical protein
VPNLNSIPARRRAPQWLGCELCERPASSPLRRLRPTLVRHDHDDPAAAAPPSAMASVQPALILLCPDCYDLLVNAIDDDEWRRRLASDPDGPAARAPDPSRAPLLLTGPSESSAAPARSFSA